MKSGTVAARQAVMGHRRLKRAFLYIRRANPKRVVLLLAACFLGVVLAVVFLVLFVQDVALSGKVFPGVTIDGHAAGGMNRDQAKAMVQSSVVAKLREPLVLTYEDNAYKLDLSKVGLAVDVDGMVDEAFRKGSEQFFIARMWRRFMNKPVSANVPVKLKYDAEGLKGWLNGVADDLDYDSTSASVDMSKGYPVVTKSKYGRKVQMDALLSNITAALPKETRHLEIPVEQVKPRVLESDIGYIVVIRQAEHKLYLYDGSTLEDTYAVAVGEPKYPTPNGRFEIVEKKKDPWWYPPKSDWAKDKKPIPPGPGNPLGPYWMGLGNMLGIHSTPDEASLGYSASHGCIRMSEWGAMMLFKVVEVGTPVYILPQ